MTPIKRVVLLRNAYAEQMGGAEVFTYNLAQELQTHGHDVLVVTSQKKLQHKCRSANIATKNSLWAGWLQPLSGVRNILLIAYVPYLLLRTLWLIFICVRHRTQLIHAQSRDDFITGTIAAKLLGRKIIWTDHADLKHIFANHAIWYKNIPGKIVYAVAKVSRATITVVSKSELQAVEMCIGNRLHSQLTIAYNGVIDNYDSFANIHPPKGAMTIGIVARLVADKGIFELLTAFKQLQKKHNDLKLIVVGDGPAREQRKDSEHVTYTGYTDSPLQHLATFDIFVYPTYHEGLSLALLEACMMQRCIVTTNVGGNPEIITNGKQGLLVPPKDAGALAAALETCIQSPELRKKLALAARARYKQTFDFSAIVKDTFIPLYNS